MGVQVLTPNINHRELSKLFSTAALRRLIVDDNQSAYLKRMKKAVNWKQLENKPNTLHDLLSFAYNSLLEGYRHEYVYKTALLNDFVLERYSLSDTLLINEFSIGNSKADLVLINGTNKVFEIKTELDSPERLNSQLNDYYKIFSEVFVVCHHTLVEKYLNLVEDKVGLLIFTESGNLEIFKKSMVDQTQLDIETMFISLRKAEYVKLVESLTGEFPDATPVKLFKTCLEIVKAFPPIQVQKEYLKIIKERINPLTNSQIVTPTLPSYLKYSCYHANLEENSYIALIAQLKCKLK